MLQTSDFVNIGSLTRPHGVHGELNLMIYDQFLIESLQPKFFFLMLNGGLVPYASGVVRKKGQQSYLVLLTDVATEAKAKLLVGSEVYVSPADLHEDETTVTPPALVGYMAIDVRFGKIGTISDIMDIAKNPLFQIDSNGKEVLIPIVDEFIIKVDKKKREITLKTPEGLIEMYLEE